MIKASKPSRWKRFYLSDVTGSPAFPGRYAAGREEGRGETSALGSNFARRWSPLLFRMSCTCATHRLARPTPRKIVMRDMLTELEHRESM